ncbi:MAG: site-specific integrase [Nannocystaceae bacterium]
MTVKVRPYKRGGWEVDIMLTFPGRQSVRERRKAPVRSKSAAKRWGEERERQLIAHYTSTDLDDETNRPGISKKEVPTLAAFLPRYIEGHCKANRLRPASIENRSKAFRNHLVPALGRRRLDRITAEDIQRFKADRTHLKGSTVNLMLTFLSSVINVAVEWGVLDKPPTRIKKLKKTRPDAKFYDFEEFDRLVLAAERQAVPSRLLMVLLGGEAGLRCGEMLGLRWSDIDLERQQLTVARAIWKGQEGPPKGGRSRTIPLGPRLAEALHEHRHLRLQGQPVIQTQDGRTPSARCLSYWLEALQRAAGFQACGPHILRHTFCSHLAMRGRPVRAIQELAGHRSITTTERYMHLSPGAVRDAIESLRRPSDWRHTGDDPLDLIKIK